MKYEMATSAVRLNAPQWEGVSGCYLSQALAPLPNILPKPCTKPHPVPCLTQAFCSLLWLPWTRDQNFVLTCPMPLDNHVSPIIPKEGGNGSPVMGLDWTVC